INSRIRSMQQELGITASPQEMADRLYRQFIGLIYQPQRAIEAKIMSPTDALRALNTLQAKMHMAFDETGLLASAEYADLDGRLHENINALTTSLGIKPADTDHKSTPPAQRPSGQINPELRQRMLAKTNPMSSNIDNDKRRRRDNKRKGITATNNAINVIRPAEGVRSTQVPEGEGAVPGDGNVVSDLNTGLGAFGGGLAGLSSGLNLWKAKQKMVSLINQNKEIHNLKQQIDQHERDHKHNKDAKDEKPLGLPARRANRGQTAGSATSNAVVSATDAVASASGVTNALGVPGAFSAVGGPVGAAFYAVISAVNGVLATGQHARAGQRTAAVEQAKEILTEALNETSQKIRRLQDEKPADSKEADLTTRRLQLEQMAQAYTELMRFLDYTAERLGKKEKSAKFKMGLNFLGFAGAILTAIPPTTIFGLPLFILSGGINIGIYYRRRGKRREKIQNSASALGIDPNDKAAMKDYMKKSTAVGPLQDAIDKVNQYFHRNRVRLNAAGVDTPDDIWKANASVVHEFFTNLPAARDYIQVRRCLYNLTTGEPLATLAARFIANMLQPRFPAAHYGTIEEMIKALEGHDERGQFSKFRRKVDRNHETLLEILKYPRAAANNMVIIERLVKKLSSTA
ncbi:MAG: hypothetical protein AAF125_05420, partial [Chloroflexota bacterium]